MRALEAAPTARCLPHGPWRLHLPPERPACQRHAGDRLPPVPQILPGAWGPGLRRPIATVGYVAMGSSNVRSLQLKCRFRGLPAVGVEGVTYDEPVREPLLIAVAAVADAVEDGQHARRHHRQRILLWQVRRPNDPGHASQRLAGDLVFIDQGLQGASALAVTELGPAEVEGDTGGTGNVPGPGHELEGHAGVDEAAYGPGGGDAVDVDP